MFQKKSIFPQEGDLLFKNNIPLENYALLVFFSVIFVGLIARILTYGFAKFDLLDYFALIFSSIFFAVLVWEIIDIIKNGFEDETFEGYYFPDKIVFYRISKHVDEYFTEKKSKEQLLKDIIELKDKKYKLANSKSAIEIEFEEMDSKQLEKETDRLMEILKCHSRIMTLEKGIQIADNPRKPHKIELEFKDVKYFMNEKDEIKVVEKAQNDENDLNLFYNKLKLSKKYKKHKSEVVEFLNQQVKETKKNIDVETD